MISQHYYTRDRKGLFSKTPGYDTVAKSSSLDNDFIVDTLHDLCFYEPPASIFGEEDVSKYPKALFCVNTEEGYMVIGRSVFAGKDYTGERNRYFTHNYIISNKEKEEYIKEPDNIIYADEFANNYDIEKGFIIPQVSKIKNCSNKLNDSIEVMFKSASIDKDVFTKLIKASFDAAKHNKKIYIVLDCDERNIENISKSVLSYLYRALPYAVRRKIGFITYMKSPKNKNMIDIIFLCRGSIKKFTTEIKAGYVFDFSEGEIYADDIDEKQYSFIDFVMNNIDNKQVLDKFFQDIDSSEFKDELTLSKYDCIFHKDTKKNKRDNELNCNHIVEKKTDIYENKKAYSKFIKTIVDKFKALINK